MINAETQTDESFQTLKRKQDQIKKALKDSRRKLDEQINQLEKCKYSCKMLLNLINDMMDLAKTEQMKFELNN